MLHLPVIKTSPFFSQRFSKILEYFYKVCIPWLIHSGLRVAKLRFGSNILILARPQSITYTMSSIVTELSAMFVAMTIFLQYGKRMQTNIRADVEDRVVLFIYYYYYMCLANIAPVRQ